MLNRITLVFPYRDISGVPILFSRLANQLFGRVEKITIVDYEDGALNKLTKHLSLDRIFLKTGERLEFTSADTVIMQASSLEYLRPEFCFHPDTRLFFWHLHPDNLKLNTFGIGPFRSDFKNLRGRQFKRLNNFVQELISFKGIVAMDEYNVISPSTYFAANLEIPLVPILLSDKQNMLEPSKSGFTNNWAYIGRIEGFKTLAIKKLLESISDYSIKTFSSPSLFLFGDGADSEQISDYAEKLNVKAISLGSIDNHSISAHVHEYDISLIFAMGTSILDGMCSGCLVAKLNYFHFHIEGYPDYYLKALENSYCLGRELRRNEFKSINSLIDLVEICKSEYSQKLRLQNEYIDSYYNNYHNISKFLDYLSKSTLKYSFVLKYNKRNMIRKSYNYIKYSIFG